MKTKNKLNNVVTKNQYQRIMEMIKTPPCRYENLSTKEIIPVQTAFTNADGTVMVHHFPKCYVDDVLGSDIFFQNLTYVKSAFISSQTGAGKTTFILKTVLNNYVRQGKRILILSSRTLLSNKLKHDTIKKLELKLEEELTEIGISRRYNYETVDILGYQQIFNENVDSKYLEHIENNISTYGVVIFDEAHFFVSDASFNRYTEKILRYITNLCFQNKVPRIYMAATPEAVFDVILKRELELSKNRNSFFVPWQESSMLNFYNFDRDYSYIDIHLFDYQGKPNDDVKNIAKIIKSDKEKQFKWVVFVNNTKFANELKSTLEKEKWRVCELNSKIIHSLVSDDSETTQKTINSLSKQEAIPDDVDVLISTKCLDVGVSIKNKNVSIISLLTDPSEFVQAIGRKRVGSNDERVHLYLPKYTLELLKSLRKATGGALRKLEESISFNTPGTTANGSSCDMPIYVDNGKFSFNVYSLVNIHNKLDFFDSIIDECYECIKGDEANIIQSYFYRLLGLNNRIKCNNLIYNDNSNSTARHSELLAIIENYSKSKFSEDERNELFTKLTKFSKYKPTKKRPHIGIQIANIILAEIGYKVRKCPVNANEVSYELYQI